MQIALEKIPKSEKAIADSLACFYAYDMSRYCGFLPNIDLSVYWEEPDRYPCFIKVDGELAGFALVHKKGSSKDIDWTIGEFFVIAKLQGKGIGKKVAHELFDKFQGKWEVMQLPENTGAILFWEKVLKEYAGDSFTKEEKIVNYPKPHPMIVMTFTGRA